MDKTNCDHYVEVDDENFLLDDENSGLVINKCFECKKRNSWSTTPMEEHIEVLEDSPLLINDCYRESDGDKFHCHDGIYSNNNEIDVKAWKKLLLASILCFLFMITELTGGFIAGSLAIMTDAAHLFSDFIGFLISLLSIWVARKSATKSMTFGYYRAEVLGAFLSVLTVWLLAAIFAMLAINRLWRSEYEIEADTMILVASLGLLVNIVMGAILYGFCHNHSHGLPQHQHNDESNLNVRAAAAHVLGDLLQSLGVLIAAFIIKFFPNAKLADPVCTLIFSIIVICTTAKVARDSIWLLLEGSPTNCNELACQLMKIGHVRSLHNLHIWTLSPGKDAIAVHLCVDKYCDRDIVLKQATTLIQKKFSIVSCTIQVESFNAESASTCRHCNAVKC